jgi:hypothetical protein
MKHSDKPSTKPPAEKPAEVEFHPDSWERFTEFVKRIAKAGPQHRASKPKERPAPSGDEHKGKTRT